MSGGPPFTVKLIKKSEIDKLAREFGVNKMEKVLHQVHIESRNWLQKRAVKNLYDSVAAHGRPQEPVFNRSVGLHGQPTTGLRKAILKESNHKIGRGFVDFMVDSEIRIDAPYYHVQEVGSGKMVGREVPIGFRGQGGAKIRAGEGRQGLDGALRGGGKLRIKHGIRGYHYIEKTVDQFNHGKVFQDYLDTALAPLRTSVPGVEIKVNKV